MIGLTIHSVTWNRFPIKNLWLIPCFFHLWSEVTWLLIPVERSQLGWVGHAITGPRNSDVLLPPPTRMIQKSTKFQVASLYFILAMFWAHFGVDPEEIREIAENRDLFQTLFCCCHCVPCENKIEYVNECMNSNLEYSDESNNKWLTSANWSRLSFSSSFYPYYKRNYIVFQLLLNNSPCKIRTTQWFWGSPEINSRHVTFSFNSYLKNKLPFFKRLPKSKIVIWGIIM